MGGSKSNILKWMKTDSMRNTECRNKGRGNFLKMKRIDERRNKKEHGRGLDAKYIHIGGNGRTINRELKHLVEVRPT